MGEKFCLDTLADRQTTICLKATRKNYLCVEHTQYIKKLSFQLMYFFFSYGNAPFFVPPARHDEAQDVSGT